MLQPYVIATLMGVLLALVGRKGEEWLTAKNLSASLSAMLVTLVLYLILVVPAGLLLLKAFSDGLRLLEERKEEIPNLMADAVHRLETWPLLNELMGPEFKIKEQALALGKRIAGGVSQDLLAVLSNIPDLLLQSFLVLASCFFVLRDGPHLVEWIKKRIPLDEEVQEKVFSTFNATAVSTVWATLAAAVSQSLVMLVGFLVLGVPGAVLAAGATFILAWIPLLGSAPVWIVACAYLWAEGSIIQVGVMIAFGIVAGLIDNVVRPIVLKGGSDMHPFVSLLAIFGGVRLFGIFGVFLGPIAIGVVIALLEIWPLFQKRLELAFAVETRDN